MLIYSYLFFLHLSSRAGNQERIRELLSDNIRQQSVIPTWQFHDYILWTKNHPRKLPFRRRRWRRWRRWRRLWQWRHMTSYDDNDDNCLHARKWPAMARFQASDCWPCLVVRRPRLMLSFDELWVQVCRLLAWCLSQRIWKHARFVELMSAQAWCLFRKVAVSFRSRRTRKMRRNRRKRKMRKGTEILWHFYRPRGEQTTLHSWNSLEVSAIICQNPRSSAE